MGMPAAFTDCLVSCMLAGCAADPDTADAVHGHDVADVLRAKRIEIVDADGRAIAALGEARRGPGGGLALMASDGAWSAFLGPSGRATDADGRAGVSGFALQLTGPEGARSVDLHHAHDGAFLAIDGGNGGGAMLATQWQPRSAPVSLDRIGHATGTRLVLDDGFGGNVRLDAIDERSTVSVAAGDDPQRTRPLAPEPDPEPAMHVHDLEVITPDVDATCSSFAAMHGVDFGDPVAALGNVRTAPLPGGGRMGVRAPMHDGETPLVRPYVLVDDVAAAIAEADAAGATIALPSMEIPGEGTVGIYVLGGVQYGVWQR